MAIAMRLPAVAVILAAWLKHSNARRYTKGPSAVFRSSQHDTPS